MSNLQSLATALMLIPAAVFGVIAFRARRQARTTLGLGLRDGAIGEFLRGIVFSVTFFGLLLAAVALTGVSRMSNAGGNLVEVAGIWVYFLVLFLLEEMVFRGLLMTGLGVCFGRTAGLLVSSVLVAAPYALAPESGPLPVAGAVLANLLHGWARWRSGRIWWGLGQRWFWNSAIVSVGFANSGFALGEPLLRQDLAGPTVVTGGAFGPEGGLLGIVFLLAMTVAATRLAVGRKGPWVVSPAPG